MNKKLLAIGIAAGLAAPGAVLADATLYGQVHLSMEYQDPDDTDSDENLAVSDNSSRIGVKGSEDLGAGLRALYQFEWAAKVDDNNNNTRGLTRRNMYGGIETDYGTLIVGRHDTPGKIVGRKADLFWSTQLGQNRTVTQGQFFGSASTGEIVNTGLGFDQRFDNAIMYLSPTWRGFKAALMYITDTDPQRQDGLILSDPIDAGTRDDNDNGGVSGSLSYEGGGLYVAYSYEAHFLDSDPIILDVTTGNPAPVDGEDAESAHRVAATYKWNDWKFAGMYQKTIDTGYIDNNDQWMAGGGVSYRWGKNDIKGQVYYLDEADELDDSGAVLYAIGVDHYFSKRTQVYFQVAALNQDDNNATPLGGAGHSDNIGNTSATDNTPYGVALGIRHLF